MGGTVVKEFEIDIRWVDRHLARDCERDELGRRRFGSKRWPVLRQRLRLLEVAPTLADLRGAPGRLPALHADRAGDFALSLWGPARLIIRPVEPFSQLDTGGTDMTTVLTIKVVEITDYHGR
jgi:hypothetical protein